MLLINKSNTEERIHIFKLRFYIFLLMFSVPFFIFGYRLFMYKDRFIYSFIMYFLWFVVSLVLSVLIKLFLQIIFYNFKYKDSKIIFWKDNLYFSVYNEYITNKLYHLSVILIPFIILTIVPLIYVFVFNDNIFLFAFASANLLNSSLDLLNIFRLMKDKNNKILFNGIDIILKEEED